MQFLRNLLVLLSIGVLVPLTALGMSASQQMAEKQRIATQLRQNLRDCACLSGEVAGICARQAREQSEAAMVELKSRCRKSAKGASGPLADWPLNAAPALERF